MTLGVVPVNPPGTEIVDRGGKANAMFGRWIAFAALLFNDMTKQFMTPAGTPQLQNFANDAAAAAGGIQIGQLYRNASVVQVRVT